MADVSASVARHYATDGLGDRILAALAEEGIDTDHLTPEILAMVDQLHTRGMPATIEHAKLIDFGPDTRVLDIGCGIGGPARYLAATFGCRVTGIDLTEEFVAAGRMLTERCGLTDRVAISQANALDLPFADHSFDVAWSQNVTMNIEDKAGLYGEIHRVLAPGGRFTFTEYVQGPGGDAIYPTVWARDASQSFIVSEDAMRAALGAAGFRITACIDDGAAAASQGAAIQSARTDPSRRLTPRLVFGDDTRERVANADRNIAEKRLLYFKVVAERAD